MKKVIFILVDSLLPEILKKGFATRSLPALQFLQEHGNYRMDCATVFPTMTASIDASLMTGSYPNEHKIPGLIWYDPDNWEMINYINGVNCVRKLGIKNCSQNVLVNLNEKHLSQHVKTIFEDLADRGHTSASINLIIHRGYKQHSISFPLKKYVGIQENQSINGPEILFLGAMVYPEILKDKIHSFSSGLRHSYGINDHFAISAATELIIQGNQPEFMMVYLPDNDHRIHKIGPEKGELSLIKVDRQIERLMNSFGSWEKAIQENILIVTSDHGQTSIGKEKDYNVDLDYLLNQYTVLQLDEKVEEKHQIVVCNNERMAYIYPLKENIQEKLVNDLKSESRIDLIAWKSGENIIVTAGGKTESKVVFSKNGPFQDPYGQSWSIEGDISIMDINLNKKSLAFNDYPDVLARLHGALFSQDNPLIVLTARPRYEFTSKYYPKHNKGGSHGSLHKFDSFIPLIVTGDEKNRPLPSRIVDLKAFILSLYD
ncbi:alkaline phosphatase family protein [Oceanobacillus salinisoli]|uniref:alkaline phosphatase family protein n=1 Tax=Oceanobacillus salinisoli TaxID=2678611 RepID=UPI0012E17230|nr:alkaline phosphatase family protein [Oceanobacillus salinisoli]